MFVTFRYWLSLLGYYTFVTVVLDPIIKFY